MRKALDAAVSLFKPWPDPSVNDILRAARNLDDAQFRLWIDAGVRLEIIRSTGVTPLLLLANERNTQAAEVFARHCPQLASNYFQSELNTAAEQRNLDALQNILFIYDAIKHIDRVSFDQLALSQIYSRTLRLLLINDNNQSNETLQNNTLQKMVLLLLRWIEVQEFDVFLSEQSALINLALDNNLIDIAKDLFLFIESEINTLQDALERNQCYEALFIHAAGTAKHQFISWLQYRMQHESRPQIILNRRILEIALVRITERPIQSLRQEDAVNTVRTLLQLGAMSTYEEGLALRNAIDRQWESDNIQGEHGYPYIVRLLVANALGCNTFHKFVIPCLKQYHDSHHEGKIKILLRSIALSTKTASMFNLNELPDSPLALRKVVLSSIEINDAETSFLVDRFKGLSVVCLDRPESEDSKEEMQVSDTFVQTLILANNQLSLNAGKSIADWLGTTCPLTVLDLSGNTRLGGGTWNYTSPVQIIFMALKNNRYLHTLKLDNCGVNDRDFRTLAETLGQIETRLYYLSSCSTNSSLNTSLIAINLSYNLSLTIESEHVLMSLLCSRQINKLPQLKITLSGAELGESPAAWFTEISVNFFNENKWSSSLLGTLEFELKNESKNLHKRALFLRGLILYFDKNKEEKIELSEYQLSDLECKFFLQELHQFTVRVPAVEPLVNSDLPAEPLLLSKQSRSYSIDDSPRDSILLLDAIGDSDDENNLPRNQVTAVIPFQASTENTLAIPFGSKDDIELSDWVVVAAVPEEINGERKLSMSSKSSVNTDKRAQSGFTLVLAYNQLRYYSSQVLSNWFYKGLCAISVLDLSFNPEFGGGGLLIYSALQRMVIALEKSKNSSLRRLILANCRVNDRDLVTLASWLKDNATLLELDLSQNKNITFSSEAVLSDLITTRYKMRLHAMRPDLSETQLKLVRSREYNNVNEAFKNELKYKLVSVMFESFGIEKTEENKKYEEVDIKTFSRQILECAMSLAPIIAVGGVLIVPLVAASAPAITAAAVAVLTQTLVTAYHILEPTINSIHFTNEALHLGERSRSLRESIKKVYDDSEYKYDISILTERCRQLSYELTSHNLVGLLIHQWQFEYAECFEHFFDWKEAKPFASALGSCFNIFIRNKNSSINWAAINDDFIAWLLSNEPQCYEILKIKYQESKNKLANNTSKNKSVNDTSHSESQQRSVPQLTYDDAVYVRHRVNPDGDCGYTAFGIDRQEAYRLLLNHVNEVRDILMPILVETFSTNEAFTESLSEEYAVIKEVARNYIAALRRRDPELNSYEELLLRHVDNLNIITAYLEYDIRDQKIEFGWCHPLILFALAHLRGIHLRLFVLNPQGEMIPHKVLPEYRSDGNNQSVDLLYINNCHFERLEMMPESLVTLTLSFRPDESSEPRNQEGQCHSSFEANNCVEWVWGTHYLRRIGFQCLSANGPVNFDIMIKNLNNKENKEPWIETCGAQYGYRKVSDKLLSHIKGMVEIHGRAKRKNGSIFS